MDRMRLQAEESLVFYMIQSTGITLTTLSVEHCIPRVEGVREGVEQ